MRSILVQVRTRSVYGVAKFRVIGQTLPTLRIQVKKTV